MNFDISTKGTKQHSLLPKQTSLSMMATFLPALPPSIHIKTDFAGAILNDFSNCIGIAMPLSYCTVPSNPTSFVPTYSLPMTPIYLLIFSVSLMLFPVNTNAMLAMRVNSQPFGISILISSSIQTVVLPHFS